MCSRVWGEGPMPSSQAVPTAPSQIPGADSSELRSMVCGRRGMPLASSHVSPDVLVSRIPIVLPQGKTFKSSLCPSGMDLVRADFKRGQRIFSGAGSGVLGGSAQGACPGSGSRSRPQGCAPCHSGCGGQPHSQPLPFHHRSTQKSHHY